ncbi:TonB-dependent receptor [Mucilaginibacter gynuensis]
MKKALLHLHVLSCFIIIVLINSGTAYAQSATGNINGIITTNDNMPAAGVTVKVTGTSKNAVADEKGIFQIKNLKAGNYELSISLVGYETQVEKVTVEDGKTINVSIELKVSQKSLQEVEVSYKRNRVTNKSSDYIARMPITNLQNAQAYNVVDKEIIKQQVIVTLTDAFRNAPGVTPALYPSGGIGVLSRGFATGIDARNGLQSTTGRSSADVANIERIEFIKGPSGTLFGGGISSFGGVVNLVTKKPFEKFQGSVDMSIGSFGLGRVTADVNTPLNADKTLLFRINTAVQRQDSYNERGFYNSSLVAPSLLYKANDRLSVLFDAELYSVNSIRPTYVTIAPGSGIKSFADLPLDYKKSLLDNDLDAKTNATKFFVDVKYKLNDNWTSSSNIAYVNEQTERSYQDYPTWISRDSVTIDVSKYGPVSNTYTNVQQNFTGKFNTGSLKHTFLAGANYTQYTGRGMSGGTDVFRAIDIRNFTGKVNRIQVDSALSADKVLNWGRSNTSTYGAYASDVINLSDRLFAMLSLRYEYIDDKSTGPWATPYTQSSLSPKLGLVYQVVKEQVSLFANYMNGYQNSPPTTQPDGSQLTIKPIYANQYEGGIKAELFDKKINTTLSYYHIAIDNAVRYDQRFFAFQDGEQVSKGLEWDFSANPTDGLTVILGYGYNKNTIIDAEGLAGNQVSNSPKNIANYWVNYQFKHGALKNFGLGAGGNYIGKAYFDDANTLLLPSYHLVNATAFYENTSWRLGLKLNNIGNEKSWGYWGAPNPTRNVVVNFTVKF